MPELKRSLTIRLSSDENDLLVQAAKVTGQRDTVFAKEAIVNTARRAVNAKKTPPQPQRKAS